MGKTKINIFRNERVDVLTKYKSRAKKSTKQRIHSGIKAEILISNSTTCVY